MSAYFFTWLKHDRTMEKAVENSDIVFKPENIVECGFADLLDMIRMSEITAETAGYKNEIGIGIANNNLFLEVTPGIKALIEESELMCPTELFSIENYPLVYERLYDRDRAMTVSLVCWNTALYTLEQAITESSLQRMENPINGSSASSIDDMINSVFAGAWCHSSDGVGIAIEWGDHYVDLSIEGGLELLASMEYDAIEFVFAKDAFKPYRKEIV